MYVSYNNFYVCMYQCYIFMPPEWFSGASSICPVCDFVAKTLTLAITLDLFLCFLFLRIHSNTRNKSNKIIYILSISVIKHDAKLNMHTFT